MAQYTTQHFSLQELVPPELFLKHEASAHLLWLLFDERALWSLEQLRARYGACTVNDWHWGGKYRFSGWRPWDCAEGASFSQHKMGRAFDCKFSGVTAEEVRQDLFRHPAHSAFSEIRRVESFDGMGWFHFDTGNHLRDKEGIKVVGRT